LVVAATIVFLPGGLVRWFLPKDALLAVAAIPALLAVPSGRLPRWFVVAIAALFLLLGLATLLGESPSIQLWGRWPRYEGAVTLPVYVASAWIGARLLARPGKPRTALYLAVCIAAIAQGVVSGIESTGLRPIPTDIERPGGLVGQATDQGTLAAMMFALLLPALLLACRPGQRLWFARAWIARSLLLLATTLALLTVFWSGCRAALVMVIIVIPTMAIGELITVRRRRTQERGIQELLMQGLSVPERGAQPASTVRGTVRGGVAVAAGLAAVAVLAIATPAMRDRFTDLTGSALKSATDRVAMWQETVGLIASRPLTGVGPSGYVDAIVPFHTQEWYDSVGTTVLDSPHSILFQTAATGGLITLAAVVALAVAVLLVGLRRWWRLGPRPEVGGADAESAALTGGAILALITLGGVLLSAFTAPSTQILGCLLVGFLVARVRPTDADGKTAAKASEPAPRRAFRVLAVPAVIAWAAFLCVTAAAEIPLQNGTDLAIMRREIDANAQFELAQTLRPWDSDIAKLASRSFARAALNDVPTAAEYTVSWGKRAIAVTPNDVTVAKALALGLDRSGDTAGARELLERMLTRAPYDPTFLQHYSEILARPDAQ
jgi:O-antigen ligase